MARMAAIRIGGAVRGCGRECKVTNGSFPEAKLAGDPYGRSAACGNLYDMTATGRYLQFVEV